MPFTMSGYPSFPMFRIAGVPTYDGTVVPVVINTHLLSSEGFISIADGISRTKESTIANAESPAEAAALGALWTDVQTWVSEQTSVSGWSELFSAVEKLNNYVEDLLQVLEMEFYPDFYPGESKEESPRKRFSPAGPTPGPAPGREIAPPSASL